MSDYPIGVRNGLLEEKHYTAMGKAIWLYLWLLDRQTKGDKVLGGKPIKHEDFAGSFPSVNERTYRRWLEALEAGGYVATLRAPHGFIITILKPKKWSESDRTKMSDDKKSERTKMSSHETESSDKNGKSHRTKSVKSSDKNVRSNKTEQRHNNIDITEPTVSAAHAVKRIGQGDDLLNSTVLDPLVTSNLDDDLLASDLDDPLTSNLLKPSALRKTSDPEIDGIIDHFQKSFELRLRRVRQQRNFAFNLKRRYKYQGVIDMITFSAAVRDEQYSPQILDLVDLWEKWDKLVSYGRRHVKAQVDKGKKVAIITEDEGES